MTSRTVTVRDNECLPVNRQAAIVTARGPEWCAPAVKPKPRKFRNVPTKPRPTLKPRTMAPQLRELFGRMNASQKSEYKILWQKIGAFPIAERIAYCRLVLGMSMNTKQGRALQRFADRARAAS